MASAVAVPSPSIETEIKAINLQSSNKTDSSLLTGSACRMPAALHAFSHLDFDGRMILQERMRRQFKRNLFMDVVYYDLFHSRRENWSEAIPLALELADFGRILKTIPPERRQIDSVVQACGMKRLGAFVAFYSMPENQDKSFLKDKDKFFVNALMAEENIFSGAGFLFRLDDWLHFKKRFSQEVGQYCDRHPDFYCRPNLFQVYVEQRAQNFNRPDFSDHR